MYKISEKDWKYFYSLQTILIERFCGQTLEHVQSILDSAKLGKSLQKIQELYSYLEKREKALVADLNDFRRSNALFKIQGILNLRLFSKEEFDGFSDELKSEFHDDQTKVDSGRYYS